MEIAVDVRSLMEGRHSGVEEYTTQIIRRMVQAAPQHHFRLFYNAAKRITLPSFPDTVSVHGLRYPNKLFNLAQFTLGQPTWDRFVPADCYFVPNFRLVPLRAGVPLVTCVHDLSFERWPEFFSWRRRLWHRLMRPRALLHRSDRIIAVSEATRADIVELYAIPADKISVVYSGVRVPGEAPDEKAAAAVRQTYRLPEKFVLHLATLEPRKNVDSLIRAFDAIADSVPHDLVVAGARGWLSGALDRAYEGARHKDRIHFPGFIAEEDKMTLYAAADLFVYPSLYEGFGFPPLEALSAGTPVITSYNSSLPEVVGEWAVLINPYDVGELALTMKELLQDPPEVAAEDQARLRQKYSWERAAQETLAIIESAAKKQVP
jgi:glycosyltransferase involved in cell wall biosynthesis